MSLEDDVQALSSQVDDLQHLVPRLIDALDNLAATVEGWGGFMGDALSGRATSDAFPPAEQRDIGPGTTQGENE